jgi:biopolymer transport protein ExbD
MSRLRRRGRGLRVLQNPEIILTPLIDTALSLLVILMLVMPASSNYMRVKVALPGGGVQDGVKDEVKISISMLNDGGYALDGVVQSRAQALDGVKSFIGERGDTAIVRVYADQGLSYGDVVGLVDEVKKRGAKIVAMATSPKK